MLKLYRKTVLLHLLIGEINVNHVILEVNRIDIYGQRLHITRFIPDTVCATSSTDRKTDVKRRKYDSV